MCADRSSQPIVHLVGSIPLPDAETVFRTLSSAVGQHLVRVPDGETGIRRTWIRFLQDVLADNPGIEVARDVPPFRFVQWDGKLIREIPRLRLKRGLPPDPASFKTGYADMAIESWGVFQRLQKAGVIPAAREVPDQPAHADRPDLQQHAAVGSAGHPARADAAIDGRGGEDRRRHAPRPHRAAVGRLPGGAGLGGLLRQGPGRFPQGDDRRPGRPSATRCRPASSSATTCATAAPPTSTWSSPRTRASWSR